MAGFETPTRYRDRQHFLLAASTADQVAATVNLAQFPVGVSGGVTKGRFKIIIETATMSSVIDPDGEYTVLVRRNGTGSWVTYGSTGTNPVTWSISGDTLQILVDGAAGALGLIIWISCYIGQYDYT